MLFHHFPVTRFLYELFAISGWDFAVLPRLDWICKCKGPFCLGLTHNWDHRLMPSLLIYARTNHKFSTLKQHKFTVLSSIQCLTPWHWVKNRGRLWSSLEQGRFLFLLIQVSAEHSPVTKRLRSGVEDHTASRAFRDSLCAFASSWLPVVTMSSILLFGFCLFFCCHVFLAGSTAFFSLFELSGDHSRSAG